MLIFTVLSPSKRTLPLLLGLLLLTLKFAIAEALPLSDFLTAEWRTSSKNNWRVSELDNELARFLEFLRRNFGADKRPEPDGKEESDSYILFNQHNHFIHPFLLLTDASGEVGGDEESSVFSTNSNTADFSDDLSSSSDEGRRPSSNNNNQQQPTTHNHHKHKHHHRRQPREMGQHHDDVIATWTNFDDLTVPKHQQSNQEEAGDGTSNSFPLIEAPLAMSNPFYRILRRAYRMLRKQRSRTGSL